MAVALFVAVGLWASAGAVEFGADLGSRVTGVLPSGYYLGYAGGVRGGAFDLLADVPLSRVFSVNFRAGGFTSSDQWKSEVGITSSVDLFALDGRFALFASAPIVKDLVNVYAGVAATFDWVHCWDAQFARLPFQNISRTGVTLGVPAGLKLRLSRRLTACVEMEVPDQGWYHDAIDEGPESKHALSWSQYGSVEPSVGAAVYYAH